MLAAITDRTRLIFVCNPNNPTSTVVDPDALARFVEAVPSRHPDRASTRPTSSTSATACCPTASGWSARTAMSLCCGRFRRPTGWPGLRVGYAVGDPDIITALGKVYVPFSATSISQAAAIASLDAADELLARTDAVVAERARVTRRTARRRLHRAAVAGQLRLAAAVPGAPRSSRADSANSRVIVRPYGDDGVRVTVAAPHENDAFLAFARRLDRRTRLARHCDRYRRPAGPARPRRRPRRPDRRSRRWSGPAA